MRASTGNAPTTTDSTGIEAEYIKNLQQQIYFLELETNYLYPCIYVPTDPIIIFYNYFHLLY